MISTTVICTRELKAVLLARYPLLPLAAEAAEAEAAQILMQAVVEEIPATEAVIQVTEEMEMEMVAKTGDVMAAATAMAAFEFSLACHPYAPKITLAFRL